MFAGDPDMMRRKAPHDMVRVCDPVRPIASGTNTESGSRQVLCIFSYRHGDGQNERVIKLPHLVRPTRTSICNVEPERETYPACRSGGVTFVGMPSTANFHRSASGPLDNPSSHVSAIAIRRLVVPLASEQIGEAEDGSVLRPGRAKQQEVA